jgi:hypothetical protein
MSVRLSDEIAPADSETESDGNRPLTEEGTWARGIGARLRLLQSSFADDDERMRRDYLAEEIERAIKDVAPSRRRTYLEALAEHFPQWEGAPGAAREAAPVDESPETIAAKLVEVAPYLTVAQKKVLAQQLEAAGIVQIRQIGVAPAPPPQPIPPELQKKLGLDPETPLSDVRVMRLIAALIDFSVALDQLAWNMWKTLAPKSVVRRDPASGDMRRIAGPYLAGDDEVSTAQITQALDKTRQLIAGLMAGIGAAGETFSKQFLARFAPPAIQEIAQEESGFFIGPEQKCWRKYVALFAEVNGVVIEKEIASAIVQYTEELILGAGRSKGEVE